MRLSILAVLLGIPTALPAQGTHTVSPGMTQAQVVAALGTPATVRKANEFSYLFYSNDCGKTCGMHDLVILRGDSVVDAIFRSPERHYTGTSSSPESLDPQGRATSSTRASASRASRVVAADNHGSPEGASPSAPHRVAATPERPAAATSVASTPASASRLTKVEIRGTTREAVPTKPKVIYVKGSKTEAGAPGPMKPPASANDAKPSIPVNPPTMQPTPPPAQKPTT